MYTIMQPLNTVPMDPTQLTVPYYDGMGTVATRTRRLKDSNLVPARAEDSSVPKRCARRRLILNP